jgi:integrase/recombinase XerC
LAPNEVHLEPASAVFEAMFSGWRRQQESRFLTPDGTQLSRCPA